MVYSGRSVKIYIFNEITKLFSDYEGIIEELTEERVGLRFQPPAQAPEIDSNILLSIGENSGVKLYSCTVSTVEDDAETTYLRCTNPKLIDTLQRRQYSRVDINAIATVSVDLSPDLAKEIPDQTLLCDGTIVNLSAGGMLLRSGQPLPTRELLGFCFELPRFGPVDVLGEVIRIIDKQEGYEMGINFVDVENWLEDELVHYIFQLEIGQKQLPKQLNVAIMQLRLEVELSTQFKIVRFGELQLEELFDKIGQGSIEQIDARHMSVRSALRLPINAQLTFYFELPGAGNLEVSGTIIGITSLPEGDSVLSIKLAESAEVERAVSKFLFMQYINPETTEQLA